jgi:uncharacterized membrane protein YdcZ (DUF606 family)
MSAWAAMAISFIVGMSIVFQGGLNRQFSHSWGLPLVILINAITFLLYAIVLVLWSRTQVGGGENAFAWPEKMGPWSYGLLIPGFCGFMIVLGVPWALKHVGALQVFVVVVAVQLTGGLLWDRWQEGIPFTPMRILGASLALVGMLVSSWPKQSSSELKPPNPTNELPHSKVQSGES